MRSGFRRRYDEHAETLPQSLADLAAEAVAQLAPGGQLPATDPTDSENECIEPYGSAGPTQRQVMLQGRGDREDRQRWGPQPEAGAAELAYALTNFCAGEEAPRPRLNAHSPAPLLLLHSAGARMRTAAQIRVPPGLPSFCLQGRRDSGTTPAC